MATTHSTVVAIADDGTSAVGTNEWNAGHVEEAGVELVIDGVGAVITAGIKADIVLPFAGTINSVTLLADQTGSFVVDILKGTYASYPPTASICASARPTLSSAAKSYDATLTGWTKTFAKGDILRFNVTYAVTVTRVLVALNVTV